MNKQLITLGVTVSWMVMGMTAAHAAVPPASLSQNSDIAWSSVINDPFDGKVVHDRNYDPSGSYAFVSSWSMQGIRATYTEYHSEVVGYHTVWRSKWVKEDGKRREVHYPEQEPQYNRTRRDRSPKTIAFAINGQVYRYDGGAVSPELAIALTNAPPGNMVIRLFWENDATTDMEIGKSTVAAWKTVFQTPRSAQNQTIR